MSAATHASPGADPARPNTREADPAQIRSYFVARGMRVLTFLGYSDSGYEDTAAMLAAAADVLDRADPRTTLVNIGATPGGIGAVYELAKQRGFETTGIVSTQARDLGLALSPHVDTVFFVADTSWGGLVAGTTTLAPTSKVIVDNSDEVIAIGGNAVAADEFDAACRAGKTVRFIAAEMNHRTALAAAARKGSAPPTDFSGVVSARFAPTPR